MSDPLPTPAPLPDGGVLNALDALEARMAQNVLVGARRDMGDLLEHMEADPMRVLSLLDMLLEQTRTSLETLGHPMDDDYSDDHGYYPDRRERRGVRVGGARGVMGRAAGLGVPLGVPPDVPQVMEDMLGLLRGQTDVARMQGLLKARSDAALLGDKTSEQWAQGEIDQITGGAGTEAGVEPALGPEPEIDAEFGCPECRCSTVHATWCGLDPHGTRI